MNREYPNKLIDKTIFNISINTFVFCPNRCVVFKLKNRKGQFQTEDSYKNIFIEMYNISYCYKI